MLKDILDQAKALETEVVEWRRTIHEYPEVGKKLPHTKKFVMEKLREFGYEPEEICESGIVATVTGNADGKTIMLRADMDALHIQEETNLDFKSENGCMHACGHDMHTAMLLGAAKLFMQNKESLKGSIKLVFQPDEEGFTGAKNMIASGVLEHPKVDVAMALHVHSGTPTGMVLCGVGTYMAGCTLFQILVKGKACHGAMPETGIDPINIATHIYLSIQEIVEREIQPTEPVVVTIGKFVAGDAPNIIPAEAVMEGTIRSMKQEVSEQILERIGQIAASTAETFRGSAEVCEISSAPPLINDKELSEEMVGYVKELVGEQSVVVFEKGGMGSEDFASYTYEVPCVYLLLGAGAKNENPEYGMPMHNEKVVFNEDVLVKGVAIHTACAIEWLKKQSNF